MYEEYLRRNLLVCKAVGAKANASKVLKRLEMQTRPPKWLINALHGILERVDPLQEDLAKWRDSSGDRPDYAMTPKTLTWDAYDWPDWVPEPVRKELRSFWLPEWGRGPRSWQENYSEPYNRHPAIGALVEAESIGGKRKHVGRWVPMWNNIGRVILDDGSAECSSTCGIRELTSDQVKQGRHEDGHRG